MVCGRYGRDLDHDNPSLHCTGTYGFHPFPAWRMTSAVFHRGHACRILGFAGRLVVADASKSNDSDGSVCSDAREPCGE